MKVAVIGANGIGSFFLRGLDEAIERNHITLSRSEVTVFDDDHVERKNTRYALYTKRDVGGKKAIIVGRRHGFGHKVERVKDKKDLKEFDLVVLAADNNKVRRLVQASGVPFIDSRAEGRIISIFNMTNGERKKHSEEYLKLTPENDKEGSCQREQDLIDDKIQYGNRIAAEIGLQKAITFLRGEEAGPWKQILNV